MNLQDKIKLLTDKKLWLAPLAGFTDMAYRSICKENGADVIMTEMVSADGILYNESNSLEYAYFKEEQRPVGIQLFGDNPLMMAKSLDVVLKLNPDFIDINMGCPVKKVVKRGAGSALLKTPKIASQIVKEMKSVLSGTEIPLSVKTRIGWDKNSINIVDFSKLMEDSGADIFILHARTQNQMFSGEADWSYIQKVKSQLCIPVVGNGDIFTVDNAKKMYDETQCDSIMIGRGTYGRPWIFDEIKSSYDERNDFHIDNAKRLEIILHHIQLSLENKGEEKTIREMRAHLGYYTKGFRGGAKIRDEINKSNRLDKVIEILKGFFNE